MLIFIIILVILFICPYTRLVLLKPSRIRYIFIDIIDKIKNHKVYKNYGIYLFGGSFGNGKSISIVNYLHHIITRYDNIEVISNLSLNDIEYSKFEYFEQLLESTPDNISRIFVIDEVGSLMNSRNYKNNKIGETQFLYMLNQCRKNRVTILLASQRYNMTDKVFRQVCVYWIECKRFWRFVKHSYYDAYDIEYSNKPMTEIKPIKCRYIFLDSRLYALYNTNELVTDFKEYQPLQIEYNNTDSIINNTVNLGKKHRHKH